MMGDWLDVLKASGIGLLALIGVVSVAVLVWPTLHTFGSIAASESLEEKPSASERRFWYRAAMGGTLGGSLAVILIAHWLLKWGAGDVLPAWWTDEIGPMADVLGVAIAGAGFLLVIFAALAGRFARRKARSFESSKFPTPAIERVRIRPRGMRFGLRHLMFAMAPLALMMVLVRDFGWSILAIMALLSPPMCVVVAFLAFTDRRSLQREALLQVLAMAAREDRPLGPAVSAFAPTCRGRYLRRVGQLANRLERGDSLPHALSGVPGVLTQTGETVARVGWDTGTLSRMLDDAIAAQAAEKAARVVAVGSIAYPVCVMGVIAGIAFFLTVYAAPRFASIFREFGVVLPEPSRTAFAVSSGWLGPISRGGMGLVEGAIAGAALGALVSILAWVGIFAGRKVLDRIPLIDRIARRRHTSVILRALAAAVEAGQPLPWVLGRLGARYPRPWFRQRLRWAAERVDRGEHWAAALRIAGLMSRSDAILLGAAERVGNLPWALRETASSGDRRLNYRLLAIGQIMRTLAVVAIGGLVLLFAVVYFAPLITLIDVMAGRIG